MRDILVRKSLDMISAANALTLPMDVRRIARHFRYSVQLYSRSRSQLDNFHLTEMAAHYPSVSTKRHGMYYIFLSDDLNGEEERWAIAHELGHIALGHLELDAPLLSREEADAQADAFALALLASPPVLEQYAIATPENIRQQTGLSLNVSRQAWQLLEQYRLEQQEAARREDIARRARAARRSTRWRIPLRLFGRARAPTAKVLAGIVKKPTAVSENTSQGL